MKMLIADNLSKAGWSWGCVSLESAIRVAAMGGCRTAWSDDTCPKPSVEEIMYLRNQP